MDDPSGTATPQVVTVNVGRPREIEWLGRTERTAIWKSPVSGRIRLAGVNFSGDDQADRLVHGGPDKAVYSYAQEDEEWWSQRLGTLIEPGAFGENLTLRGVDVTGALIGERWEIGSSLLEVAQPRMPCWKLGARFNDPDFPPVFANAGRPGAYLRILREGDIAAGDEVRIVYRPPHNMSVGEVSRIYHEDHSKAYMLLETPLLAARLRQWAGRVVRHSGRGREA